MNKMDMTSTTHSRNHHLPSKIEIEYLTDKQRKKMNVKNQNGQFEYLFFKIIRE